MTPDQARFRPVASDTGPTTSTLGGARRGPFPPVGLSETDQPPVSSELCRDGLTKVRPRSAASSRIRGGVLDA